MEPQTRPFSSSSRWIARSGFRNLGVPSEVITLEGAPHNVKDWAQADAGYGEKITAWLERTLSGGAAAQAEAPAIKPDLTVAPDGTGDFRTVQEAVNSIPRDNHERVIVLVKDGVYREKVRIDPACVTLRGQSRKATRIEYPQLNDDFTSKPDDIGRAVVNVNGDDFVLDNLTVANTAGIVGPHSFAVYGKADRVVIVDCDVLSEGADTVSLWKAESGRYYHARCHFRGAVDFVCPRGWCYVADCTFYETKATAAVWHDGYLDRDMKFVLKNCKFDGVEGYNLARHHHDAQFYFLNCLFSQTMSDRAPFRVIYPLNGATASTDDTRKNTDLDKSNIWGERAYYYNCHRAGGDYAWHKDNLASAPNSPSPAQITAAWTFAGRWDPERHAGPFIKRVAHNGKQIEVVFNESVTVKGKPRLVLKSGESAEYAGGSGRNTLAFAVPAGKPGEAPWLDFQGGAIIATEATAALLVADLALP